MVYSFYVPCTCIILHIFHNSNWIFKEIMYASRMVHGNLKDVFQQNMSSSGSQPRGPNRLGPPLIKSLVPTSDDSGTSGAHHEHFKSLLREQHRNTRLHSLLSTMSQINLRCIFLDWNKVIYLEKTQTFHYNHYTTAHEELFYYKYYITFIVLNGKLIFIANLKYLMGMSALMLMSSSAVAEL